MAFFGKARKEDLRFLAVEMNETVDENMKIVDLKNVIKASKEYEEGFVKALLENIISARLEKAEIEETKRREEAEEQRRRDEIRMEENKRREESEENKRREELEEIKRKEENKVDEIKRKEEVKAEEQRRRDEIRMEELKLEQRRLEIKAASSHEGEKMEKLYAQKFDIQKLVPRFDEKSDDVSLFLALFERQAKIMEIPVEIWVAQLISVLPSDIVALIAREPETEASSYEYVKKLLLKRFKLGPEKFRQRFVKHQKKPDGTWRDFYYDIRKFLEEWLEGLEITTFEQLKDLMIVDQIKRKAPTDVREHFLDIWSTLVSPTQLTEKLDDYEEIRQNFNKRPYGPQKEKSERKTETTDRPRSPYFEKSRRPWPIKYDNWYSPRKVDMKSGYADRKPKFNCFKCGLDGHIAKFCLTKTRNKDAVVSQSNLVTTRKPNDQNNTSEILTAKVSLPVATTATNIDALEVVDLKCAGNNLKGILDSGAQISVVRFDKIDIDEADSHGTVKIVSAFGESEEAPLMVCMMKIDDGMHGEVPITCAISKKLISDMLICRTAYDTLKENIQLFSSEVSPLPEDDGGTVIDLEVTTLSHVEAKENIFIKEQECCQKTFVKLQTEDETLKEAWKLAENKMNGYFSENGILFHSDEVCGEEIRQVVLPHCKRTRILEMGHDIPLAGHLGEAKTRQRIKYSFFWPTLKKDVKDYCNSCKVCQLRRVTTYRDRIPIRPIVRPETPFDVWSVDCIGPLEPASGRGHKYIICAVDLCTRWAEAVPVKNITAKTTCDVLMKIFSQTGFPSVICTDQGTNFTSHLTKAFLDTLGIAPRFSTPGHPESMGAVERWNRTLKDMLNKNIQEHGRNWDLHLPFLLFAYREVPHSTTGLSPFQMVYGRIPSGPLTWVKDFWTGKWKIPVGASQAVETYISDLQERLKHAYAIASENAEKSQNEYSSRYNLRSREKTFEVGNKVLILMPSSSHKLLNTWQGPAEIVKLTRPHSALVQFEDGNTKELHVNKLRPFISRVQHVGLIFDQDEDFGEIQYAPTDKTKIIPETIKKQIMSKQGDLDNCQSFELSKLLCQFTDVFSKQPGSAKADGHSVRLTPDSTPKRQHPYRIPVALQEEVERQIKELLELGLIEPSNSEWAHPVVCVAKKNGEIRLCVDYRLLNSFTVADAYPMKRTTELVYEIGKANYITVLDLTKGYWQIPMKDEAKSFTAFVTHSGHYQWNVLPFGMKNAGSTFQKVMDGVLIPHRKYSRAYIDDVAIFSENWKDHLNHIQSVFNTLRDVGLTVNLEKCHFGKREVKFLGHIIGSGKHSPDPAKVETMLKMSRPTNKKEVRSVLGLANYYRDYIKDFSALVLPLTNLTKKRAPNYINWGHEEEKSFQKLKDNLANLPSLYTPIMTKPFQLYTDASATAVGACLSQTDEEGQEHPIAFFSKKLTPCQTRWSTIEREAYSVMAALQKFDTWIFGAEVQVISDHNPLTYLTKTHPHGAKLARWALALQRYNLKISYRKGIRHGNADALSRLPSSE